MSIKLSNLDLIFKLPVKYIEGDLYLIRNALVVVPNDLVSPNSIIRGLKFRSC